MTMYLFRCCGLIAEFDNSAAPTVTLPHACTGGIPQIGIADAQNIAIPPSASTVAETNVADETLTVDPSA